jgi:hypothetical protein
MTAGDEIIMRHAVITIHLLDQAREAAVAPAEADERLEHQAQATPGTQPAEPGRSGRVEGATR